MYFAPEFLVFDQLEEIRKEAAARRLALSARRARRLARREVRERARAGRRAHEVRCNYAAGHAGGQA